MNTAADRHYAHIPGYEHYAKDPLQELYDKWLDRRRATVKPSSIRAYNDRMNDIIRFAKGRPFSEMDQEWALSLVDYMLNKKKLNPNTARDWLKYFRFVINFAVEEGILEKPPFSFKKLPRIAPAKIDKRPFSYAQYMAVRAEVSKEKYSPFWPDTCAIAWHTGLRISDIAHMKRSLVDLDGQIIHSKTMKKSAEREMLDIPMEPDLVPVMHRLMTTPPPYPTEFVLPHLNFRYNNEKIRMTFEFRAACDAVGLHTLSFHSFRHSFVSRLVNAGVDSLVISAITGQSIEQIAEYAHISINAKLAALAKSRGEQAVKVIEL